MDTNKTPLTKQQLKAVLDTCYNKAIDGIPKVSEPVEIVCEKYLQKYHTPEKAAKAFIARQKFKCATSGFLTGFGGFITLPVAVPANLASVFYVQLRMIAAVAKLGGFNPREESVHTLCYACLSGKALNDILKGKKLGLIGSFTNKSLEVLSGKEMNDLNDQIISRLLTKLTEAGIMSVGKTIPVIGGFIGSGFDFVTTGAIADNAYLVFIEQKL